VAAHHLLPAGMRELPPPWNDMTWERKPKLEELPHTEANEEAALGALTAALSDQITKRWTRSVLSSWSHDVLWWLKQEPHDKESIAAVAERCVRGGLSALDAVILLSDLGTPHGEKALLHVVRDDEVSEPDRAWARDQLIDLRRPGYDVRGQEPAQGESALLPLPVQELPYRWGFGFQWPPDLPESEENIARARAILEACAPVGPVPEAVPAPDWDGDEDEEQPAWLDVRAVMSRLMPSARQVTRERMTETMRESALLGISGAPQDPEGEEAERFVRRWVTWIGGWIAGEVFAWLGLSDFPARITPWAMDLAERYARNGVAADQAVGMLRWPHIVPDSREALARIAADDSVPSEVRESARAR
jgi:hypothetical protein